MSRTAVILIALGGPRNLDEVGPFMTAFLGRPAPPPLVESVKERYRLIGGGSPLPELVRAQAVALEKEFGDGFHVYEGFRYSSPAIGESFDKAVHGGASHIIGLSMSPYETAATTGVYRKAFEACGRGAVRVTFIPSWHDNTFFIDAWEERLYHGLKRYWTGAQKHVVVIFTSHSIPLRYVQAGDPYRRQIEETAALVARRRKLKHWYIAWQSKGTHAKEPWLDPDVETIMNMIVEEKRGKHILEIPIGFTCDHLETLYDIDIVHRKHALELGLTFERAESLNTSPLFIRALADVVRRAL